MSIDELPSTDDDASLSDLLALATAEPDDTLLWRYARSLSGNGDTAEAMSPAEEKWVQANIAVNPLWQQRWREISKSTRARSGLSQARRGVLAFSVLAMAALLWLESAHDAGISTRTDLDNLVHESSSALRSPTSGTRPRGIDVVAEGAWTLAPTIDFRGLPQLLADLERRFHAADDPFERAELAYRIAGLSEAAGRTTDALLWYERCSMTRSAEYSELARESTRRLQQRIGH